MVNGFDERGRYGHVAWARSGDRADLLLLHGVTDSAACWTGLAASLAEHWGLVATDARGHGESGLPEEPFDYREQAEDAAGVLTELADGPVVVLGHSMGAMTAAVLARSHPELVRALVLEDPPAMARRRSGAGSGGRWSMPEWLVAARALDYDARVARCRADNPDWPEDELAPWARSKELVDPRFFELRRPEPSPPLTEVLAEVRCPVLLVHGDTDRGSLISAETAEALAAAAAGPLRAVHLAGAGHSVHRDRRAPYLDAVSPFLAEVGAASA